jgi:hypothetical protein
VAYATGPHSFNAPNIRTLQLACCVSGPKEELMTSPATTFRVGSAIGFGWRMTWRNFWRILLVGIVFTAIGFATSVITGVGSVLPEIIEGDMTTEISVGASLIGSIIQFLVSIFLALGMIRIAIDVTKGHDVHVGRLFAFNGYGRYLLSGILVSIIIAIGFAIPFLPFLAIAAATENGLWLIPGGILGVLLAIVLILGLSLYGYFIIDRDAPKVSGLRESWAVVRPHFWPFLGLHILLALINIGLFVAAFILGLLLVVVGLVVTIPLAMVLVFGISALALAYAYRTMSGQEVVGAV